MPQCIDLHLKRCPISRVLPGLAWGSISVQGCKPDGITYAALIAAYEKGGQWMRALRAHEGMQMQVRVQRSPHLLLSVTQIQGLQLIPPCACPGYPAGCSVVQQPDGGIVAEWHPACPGKGVPVVGGCQPQRTVQVRLGGTNVVVPLQL